MKDIVTLLIVNDANKLKQFIALAALTFQTDLGAVITQCYVDVERNLEIDFTDLTNAVVVADAMYNNASEKINAFTV